MNAALWGKTFREGKWLLLGCGLLLWVFHWLLVWITSLVQVGEMRQLLRFVPDFIQGFFVVPVEVMAAPAGRIAIGYEDPLVMTVVSIWAIARGSDSVSGEIGRGTMEMLLAQPVRRVDVLATHTAFSFLGAALLAICCWLGTVAGLATFELEDPISAKLFIPAAVSLFSISVFLIGVTTCLSSLDRYRSRTIGLVVGFVTVATLIKMISLSAKQFAWMRYFSFLTLHDPQRVTYYFWPDIIASQPGVGWSMLVWYNGLLLFLGLLATGIALALFCHRDLPAPL